MEKNKNQYSLFLEFFFFEHLFKKGKNNEQKKVQIYSDRHKLL